MRNAIKILLMLILILILKKSRQGYLEIAQGFSPGFDPSTSPLDTEGASHASVSVS